MEKWMHRFLHLDLRFTMYQRLGATSKNLDDGEIFTFPLSFSRCDDCGLLILLHGHRYFSVWSDFGRLQFHEHVENDAPSLQDASPQFNYIIQNYNFHCPDFGVVIWTVELAKKTILAFSDFENTKCIPCTYHRPSSITSSMTCTTETNDKLTAFV